MPLARHDAIVFLSPSYLTSFYSHASCEAWHNHVKSCNLEFSFLLTCLLRGMTSTDVIAACISGFLLTCLLRGMTVISCLLWPGTKFLLTCLLRGMTSSFSNIVHNFCSFYSHASCEAWRHILSIMTWNKVSTHMPLARHDAFIRDMLR